MTSGATGVDTKAWEHVKYYYDTQAWLPKNVVFVSQKAFDALDKATQDAVLKAAADAEERGWKDSEEKAKRVPRDAREERHDRRPAVGAAQGGPEEDRRHDAADWVKSAGRGRAGDRGRVPGK